MMSVYEVWRAVDGSQWGMQTGDHPQRDFLSRDVDGNPMELVASFACHNWKQAKEAYEAVMRAHSR